MVSWAERIRLEEELRERVQVAQNAYNNAKHEYERLSALVNDLGPNHPDGALALKRAVQLGRETLDSYQDALRIFTDLALRNMLP